MNEKNTPTHARAKLKDSAYVINVLTQLKAMLTLGESDPLCRQASALYDNVERTLKSAYQQLEDANDELRRNKNEDSQEPRDS
jgi:hypothetical protein